MELSEEFFKEFRIKLDEDKNFAADVNMMMLLAQISCKIEKITPRSALFQTILKLGKRGTFEKYLHELELMLSLMINNDVIGE